MMANAPSISRAAIGAAVFRATRRAPLLNDVFGSLPGLAEVPQETYTDARRAWFGVVRRDVSLVAIGVGGTRDVEVDPRHVGHELLQEQCRGDRTRAAAASVAH